MKFSSRTHYEEHNFASDCISFARFSLTRVSHFGRARTDNRDCFQTGLKRVTSLNDRFCDVLLRQDRQDYCRYIFSKQYFILTLASSFRLFFPPPRLPSANTDLRGTVGDSNRHSRSRTLTRTFFHSINLRFAWCNRSAIAHRVQRKRLTISLTVRAEGHKWGTRVS